jgi:hypothetical protein
LKHYLFMFENKIIKMVKEKYSIEDSGVFVVPITRLREYLAEKHKSSESEAWKQKVQEREGKANVAAAAYYINT